MMNEGQGRPPSPSLAELERKRAELIRKQKEVELKEGLPFLYGWKWYTWARTFYESQNKMALLCAANQVSKSSTQIRTCINWGTNQALWPELWALPPTQFWYMYPTGPQATIEFAKKWSQFLPRGKFKTELELDGKPNPYAWKGEYKNKEIHAIHFLVTGVTVYFKTYAQEPEALQTGSVDALFGDEEMPVELYDELIFRVSATNGYFRMVFTATIGQEFWRLAMEPEEHEEENLPDALKICASLYDSQVYEDGTPSHWTTEKIEMVKARCRDASEVLRRVFGRFIRDTKGRKYPAFDIKNHILPKHPLPENWIVYAGLDVGSGGANHPAAVCFVAVRPDFRAGRVFLGWRGDGQVTTAGDTLAKYLELRDKGIPGHPLRVAMACYDHACRDLFTIATRSRVPLVPADKGHETGEQIVNDLFKSGMLRIYSTPELAKLAGELATLRKDTPKTKAKDDFSDALRYAVTQIPWDWTALKLPGRPEAAEYQAPAPERELTPMEREIADRRAGMHSPRESDPAKDYTLDDEFEEINADYEG
jgi:phage terminase large subunit-like protein